MKKRIRCVFLTVFMMAFAFVLCVNPFLIGFDASEIRERIEKQTEDGMFTFPASLKTVGEEAFEGTGVARVILQDGTEELGARTFANTPDLWEVYIPGSMEMIAEDTFDSTGDFTVYAPEGSAADDWAQAHRVPFEARDIWNESARPPLPLESLLLLLLAALLPWGLCAHYSIRIRRTAQTVANIAMNHRKRAELFVRNLCFP